MYTNIVFGNDLCDTRSKRASVVPYTFVKNLQKDGSYLYCLFTTNVLYSNGGTILGYLTFVHEVTEPATVLL